MPWYEIVLRVLLAVAAGCVIGAEREHQHRPAGLRTHILVCLGAALVALMECLNVEIISGETGVNISLGRMSAQVISGIGFLGAGTIFVASRKIAGLTTAASLWCTGCLGLAAGLGHYVLLAVGGAVVVLTLALLPHLVPHDRARRVAVTCRERETALPLLRRSLEQRKARLADLSFRDTEDLCTLEMSIHLPRKFDFAGWVEELSHEKQIASVRMLND